MNANSVTSQWIIDDLAKSGLTLEDFPVILLQDDAKLFSILGFTEFEDRKILEVGGYFIPYPNVPGFSRLKLKESIGKCKYLSPRKERCLGNHPFIPSQIQAIVKEFNPDRPLILTEGEKKAACGVKQGFNVIGLPGIWCFKDSDNDFLPGLEELNLRYRKCFICFDSDITDKHSVRHAELRLAVELINRDAIPILLRLPTEQDVSKNGLDDFLVKSGRGKFEELLKKTVSSEKVNQPFELHLREKTPIDLLIKESSRIKSPIERESIIKLIAKDQGIAAEIVKKQVERLIPKPDETNSDNTTETFTE